MVFHGITAVLFPIGMFPWIMIALTPIFFGYDWPDRLLAALGRRPASPDRPPAGSPTARRPRSSPSPRAVVVQIALPLRHLAYPGDVRWTEEGYYLSWRVMLTEKAGSVDFRVTDPASGRSWRTGPGSC